MVGNALDGGIRCWDPRAGKGWTCWGSSQLAQVQEEKGNAKEEHTAVGLQILALDCSYNSE